MCSLTACHRHYPLLMQPAMDWLMPAAEAVEGTGWETTCLLPLPPRVFRARQLGSVITPYRCLGKPTHLIQQQACVLIALLLPHGVVGLRGAKGKLW